MPLTKAYAPVMAGGIGGAFRDLAVDFEIELANFSRSLPESYSSNVRNLYRQLSTPSRTSFIMLHTWLHHTYCTPHILWPVRSVSKISQS